MAAARDACDSLLRDRGLRRIRPEVTTESLLRGAAASAALEGSRYDVEALRAGAGDATAFAAVRLSAQLLGVLSIWRRAPVQALARLHAVAGAGALPPEQLGRPVSSPAAHRLTSLARTVTDSAAAVESGPAMVVAAVVHAEIATAAAFASHNGLVARAAERLVLVASGVDPAAVTIPERGHLLRRDEHGAALQAYAGGEPAGVRRWLLHAAGAYTDGAEAAGELLRG